MISLLMSNTQQTETKLNLVTLQNHMSLTYILQKDTTN